MNTRLQQFLSAENMTQAQFADSIDVARASISHIIAGRNKPGYDFIVSTMKRYPDLNIEWLMTGKGKMYKSLMSEPGRDCHPGESAATDGPLHDEDGDGGLFASREDDISRPATDESVRDVATEGNTAGGLHEKPGERPVKQRKAMKIVVFYDDGTFQEF